MEEAGADQNVPLEERNRQIVGDGELKKRYRKRVMGEEHRSSHRREYGSQLARQFGARQSPNGSLRRRGKLALYPCVQIIGQ